MRNIVGNQVKAARKKLSLTQDNLAAKLQLEDWEISRSGVAKIENGFRQITDKELVKLAKVLDVPVTYLLNMRE